MQPMRTYPARSRAHLPRGRWPWDVAITRYTAATACSRRAAPRGKKDGFVAGTRAPRSGLPRVSVRVLASMRTGSPDRRCSCTLCCTVPSRSSSATSTWSVSSPPGQATHATTSPQGTHYSRCTPRAPPRASRASNPPTPAATRRRRTALAAGTGCRTAPRFTHTAWRRPQTRGRRPVGMDARRLPPRPGACASSKHSPCGSSSRPLSASRRTFELNSHRFGSATAVE